MLFDIFYKIEDKRTLNELSQQADYIISLTDKYSNLTDIELTSQTDIFKQRLNEGCTLDNILSDAFAVAIEATYRILNIRHYKVQIMGGICLHQGRIAEMQTGEGKTIVEILPIYLNALTGNGVHIATVNEYLAKRDAEWVGKVFKFLKLSVGVITNNMNNTIKKKQYDCDITYGVGSDFGFDYLRDHTVMDSSHLVQRNLNFAIIDEVDSILIDEARIPLIISNSISRDIDKEQNDIYIKIDKFVKQLKEKEDYIVETNENDIYLTEHGASKAEEFFGSDIYKTEDNLYITKQIQNSLIANYKMRKDYDYIVKNNKLILIDEFTGRISPDRTYCKGLHQALQAKENVKLDPHTTVTATFTLQNYFKLYNKISGMTGTAKTDESEFRYVYWLDVVSIPTNKKKIRQDLPDIIYKNEKSKFNAVIDEVIERHAIGQPILIGTTSIEKSEILSKMLLERNIKHNVLNAKNHEREAAIISQAGVYNAITISTNMAGRGTDIKLGGNAEYLAKTHMIQSGVNSDLLDMALSHTQHNIKEIEFIKNTYDKIYAKFKKETEENKKKVLEAGGLCVIGTEHYDAIRIDNQLRGRCGRQGDPGTTMFFVSLEDEALLRINSEYIKSFYDMLNIPEDQSIQNSMISNMIYQSLKTIEGINFGSRKHLLEFDDVVSKKREKIYNIRQHLLKNPEYIIKLIVEYTASYAMSLLDNTLLNIESIDCEKIIQEINNVIYDNFLIENICDNIDCTQFINLLKNNYNKHTHIYDNKNLIQEFDQIYKKILEKIYTKFNNNMKYYKDNNINIINYYKNNVIQIIDEHWKDFLKFDEQLREDSYLKSCSGDVAINYYKESASSLFKKLKSSILENSIEIIYKNDNTYLFEKE